MIFDSSILGEKVERFWVSNFSKYNSINYKECWFYKHNIEVFGHELNFEQFCLYSLMACHFYLFEQDIKKQLKWVAPTYSQYVPNIIAKIKLICKLI